MRKSLDFSVSKELAGPAYLRHVVTQRAAKEGQDDVENPAPGTELVAVLVPDPLPQEPEDPLPLGAVLSTGKQDTLLS